MSVYDNLYSDNGSYATLCETMDVLNETNKVVFDKATKKKRLLRQCELICAKEAGDALYEKYAKATKIRRKTRELIHAKYEGKAKVKAKEFLKARKVEASKK